jgi:hypothetical protein
MLQKGVFVGLFNETLELEKFNVDKVLSLLCLLTIYTGRSLS